MSAHLSPDAHNLYDLLGVAPDANAEEIRRAFRSLARLVHPDTSSGSASAERFALVAHAYAVLSDGQRRRAYDASRRPLAGSSVHMPQASRSAPPARGVLRGADVEVHVPLSLREAAFGTEVRVDVSRREVCITCLGRGAADGGVSGLCPVCQGTGGTRAGTGECKHCHGSGVIGDPPCPACLGSGRRRGLTSLVVAVPAAVDTGQPLVLKGDGDVGPRNGPRGDLLLHVDVMPDPVLQRSGIDILMNLPISPHDAAVGCSVEVPTLRGPKRLDLPPQIKDRTLIRIGGAGIRPHGSWHRGDQFVTVVIQTDQPNEPQP